MYFKFLTFLFLSPVLIQAQSFDHDFAGDGFLRINIDWFDEPVAMDSSPDGSILLLANSGHQDSLWYDQNLALIKFTSAGVPDSSFGSQGVLVFDSGPGYFSQAKDIITDDQGTIYVLSTNESLNSGKSVIIQSFNSNGAVNHTFGTEGKYECRFLSAQNDAGKFAMFNNRIVVAATAFDTTSIHRELPALLVLRPDGIPDSSFGGTGKMVFDIGSGIIYPHSAQVSDVDRHNSGGFFTDLVLNSNGIIAGGAFSTGADYRCMLASVDWTGQPDSSFYYHGILVFEQQNMLSAWISKLLETEDHTLIAGIRNTPLFGTPQACLAIINHPASTTPQFMQATPIFAGQANDITFWQADELIFSCSLMDPENYQGFINSEFAGLFQAEILQPAADSFYIAQVDAGLTCEAGPLFNYMDESLFNALKISLSENDLSTDICIIRFGNDPAGLTKSAKQINHVNVYPVPVNEFFFVEMDPGDKLTVFDCSGRQILTMIQHGNDPMQIQCHQWNRGTYPIFITNKQGIRKARTIIKN